MSRATEYTHYYLTGKEKAYVCRSHGEYKPSAACSTGMPVQHLRTSRKIGEVTCPECLKKIGHP